MAEDDGISWIVEAMRKIHRQKQRRTVDRIIYAVRQKYGISTSEITACLERAEQHGIIQKIVDDNICFYKECNGVARKQSELIVMHNILSKLKAAMLKGSGTGYSMKNLVKNVREQCSSSVPDDFNWRRQVCLAVKRLIKDGMVQRVGKVLWPTDGIMSNLSDLVGDGINNNGAAISGIRVNNACMGIINDTVDQSLARCASGECQAGEATFIDSMHGQCGKGIKVGEPTVHRIKQKQSQHAFLKKSRENLSHSRLTKDLDFSHANETRGQRTLRRNSGKGNSCIETIDLNKCSQNEHSASEMAVAKDVCSSYSQCATFVTSTDADDVTSCITSNPESQNLGSLQTSQCVTTSSIILSDAYLALKYDSENCVTSCAELIDDIICCVAPQETLSTKSNSVENEVRI
jgi:hypothetical protein